MTGLATMLLNSLSHKKTSVQTFPRSIKLLFFSAGLISILFIFIGVVAPSSYDMVLLTLKKAWFFVRQLLSSPFFICIIINFMVILIAASYVMETKTNHFQGNDDSVSTTSIYYHDYDLQLQNTLAPSILPPPIDAVPSQRNGIHPNTTYNTINKEEATLRASFSFKNNVGSHQICQDEIFAPQKPCSLDCTAEIGKAQEPGRSERIKKGENKLNGLRKAPENERKSGLVNTNTVETDDTMEATWRAITEGGAKTTVKRDIWAQPIFSQENTEEMDSEELFVPKSGHVLQSTLATSILPPKNNVGSHQICQDEIFAHLTEIKENRKPYSLDCTAEIGKAQKPGISERIKKGQNKSNGQRKAPEITKTVETDDTMEATWKAITEGGAKTEKKALKKRDTWDQPIFSQENTEEIESEELLVPKSGNVSKELRKSMTFNETVSLRFRGGMMRGPSISLEELHGRVEAHIMNFNNEMRLQRQESEQRYQEMLNRNI